MGSLKRRLSHTYLTRRYAGSILIVCMVFLAALSITAMAAFELSLLGRKMIFAYANHNNAFLDAENQLLEVEQQVWQQLDRLGLTSTMSIWSAEPAQEGAEHISVTFAAQWAKTELSTVQCGNLFSVTTMEHPQASSTALRPSAEWFVCCETALDCEQSRFLSTRRQWRRGHFQ
jgi:Tfp pilus assembly protein PilX